MRQINPAVARILVELCERLAFYGDIGRPFHGKAHPHLPTGQAEALATSLCDRRLGSNRLSYLEALEFGMLQIEWPGHFVAGARVRSAELLRFGPCLEGGFALPHCMGGIERMVFGLGP